MLTLIIILAALGAGIYFSIKEQGPQPFFGLLVLGSVLITITLVIGSEFMVEHSRADKTYQIYSLRNDSSINGSFFLGSGQINRREYYYMFAKNSRGGYIRNILPINECALFQDSNAPYVHYQEIKYRQNRWISFVPFYSKEGSIYNIHVPENTIVEKFEAK